MAFPHSDSHRSLAPSPTTLLSPVTPSTWAQRVRLAMRSTIGLPESSRAGNVWSFPSLASTATRRRLHDWEENVERSTALDVGTSDTAEPIVPPLHAGIRLRALPPYPPQPVFELVPTTQKATFVLGRRVHDPALEGCEPWSEEGNGQEPDVINLHSRVVSKRHAMIQFTGDEVYITDLQSTHGTWILRDGTTDHFLGDNVPFALSDGDEIRIGRRVQGHPAVHLMVELIAPSTAVPRGAVGADESSPMTPNLSQKPLTPPPSGKRKTNSFRAPDFSDMDISRSPSPLPVTALETVPMLGYGLQSPIVLDNTPSPARSRCSSPLAGLPDSSDNLPSSDILELMQSPKALLSPSHYGLRQGADIVGQSNDVGTDIMPSRDPRPYEFIRTSSAREVLILEPRPPSPRIDLAVSDEAAAASADILPNATITSFMLPHPAFRASPEPSAFFAPPDPTFPSFVTAGENRSTEAASVELVPEAAQTTTTTDADKASLGLAEDAGDDAPITSTDSVASAWNSEQREGVTTAKQNHPTCGLTDEGQNAILAHEVECEGITALHDDLGKQEGRARSGVECPGREPQLGVVVEPLQQLAFLLSDIRRLPSSAQEEATAKWQAVDHLLHCFPKGNNKGGLPDVGVRKRKRDDMDDGASAHTGDVSAPRATAAMQAAETSAISIQPTHRTKRRRTFGPSSVTAAFLMGGIAAWFALGFDYGL